MKGDDLEQLLKEAADMNFYGSLDPKIEDALDVNEPKEDAREESMDVNEPKEDAVEHSIDVNEAKEDAVINYRRLEVVTTIFDTGKQDKHEESRVTSKDEKSDKAKSDDTQLRPSFLCFQCGQSFFDSGNYSKHLRVHKVPTLRLFTTISYTVLCLVSCTCDRIWYCLS